MSLSKIFVFGVVASLLTAACGDAPDLSDFNKADREAADENQGLGGESPIGNQTPVNTDLQGCATQSAAAEARPVYLIFQYDKSGSMDDNGKWNACKAATRAFFESSESAGVKASLTFFPTGSTCSDSSYESPAVPITALPSSVFGSALDSRNPSGGTPTRHALQGAINYAQQVAAGEGKDGNVAIVLVTDGQPANCSDNSISTVRNIAASVASTIPTYVIGVGNQLGNLNEIAVGGGTNQAFIVSTGDPAQTQAQLLGAIKAIKQQALACDYTIPTPTDGQRLDHTKVNVQYAPQAGSPSTLSYNQSCAGGTGWQYDNADSPTRILLCDSSCNTVKTAGGKVDIVYGCATQVK